MSFATFYKKYLKPKGLFEWCFVGILLTLIGMVIVLLIYLLPQS
jgi:uncharacterized membrane protein